MEYKVIPFDYTHLSWQCVLAMDMLYTTWNVTMMFQALNIIENWDTYISKYRRKSGFYHRWKETLPFLVISLICWIFETLFLAWGSSVTNLKSFNLLEQSSKLMYFYGSRSWLECGYMWFGWLFSRLIL